MKLLKENFLKKEASFQELSKKQLLQVQGGGNTKDIIIEDIGVI